MAIGVFVGITPTIPFHTVLAVGLAFLFGASKTAAAIGVWFSNPLTIPVLYVSSFKVGSHFLGREIPFGIDQESLSGLLRLGLDVTAAMLTGGIVIALPLAVTTYFLTRWLLARYRPPTEPTTAEP